MEVRPLVSVIIPNYNRTRTLQRAIKSVLNQSFSDFEILVVDDGSSIDPAPFIDELEDNRIHLIRHSINKNASAARNTGAHNAKGKYLAFLDSDDEWLPNHLERRIHLIQKSNPDGIYGGVLLNKGGELNALPPVRDVKSGEHFLDYLLSNACRASTPTLFIKKERFLSVLFDETLSQNQDYDFNIRFYREFKYLSDQEPTVIVHLSGEDRMGKKINHTSCLKFINKHKNDLPVSTYQNYLLSMMSNTLKTEGKSKAYFTYFASLLASMPNNSRLYRAITLTVPLLDFRK